MTLLLQVNILVSPSSRACLSDFDLATARDLKRTVRTYMSTNRTAGHCDGKLLSYSVETMIHAPHLPPMFMLLQWCAMRWVDWHFVWEIHSNPWHRCFLGHILLMILWMISGHVCNTTGQKASATITPFELGEWLEWQDIVSNWSLLDRKAIGTTFCWTHCGDIACSTWPTSWWKATGHIQHFFESQVLQSHPFSMLVT